MLTVRHVNGDFQTVWQAMRDFTDQRTPETPDELWFVEHPPVFTQGLSGKSEHLLRDIQRVLKREVEVVAVEGFSPSQALRTSMSADLGPRKPAHKQQQRAPKHARRPHHQAAKPSHHAGAPTRRPQGAKPKRFGQR